MYFVLREVGDHVYSREEIEACVHATIDAWQAWAKRSSYAGRWREQVTRSALALKLLVSHEHGSIAAAATFGLPEASGAGRNWDYRATWIRDASFTVYAFIRLGYINEVERFRAWGAGLGSADPGKTLNVMYSLDGTQAADETELDHLTGYGGSRPVRIGNAARNQTQLDIYGELLDSVYLANKYGTAVSHDRWSRLSTAVEYVIGHWEAADAGIWEIRAEPRHFLHSRMMCWVALDRAVRLAQKRSLPAPIGRWLQERDRISEDIWTHFRHPQNGHFVQRRGGTELDASLLMMPLVRFVSATDRMAGNIGRDSGRAHRWRLSHSLPEQRWARRRSGVFHDLYFLVRGMPCARRAPGGGAAHYGKSSRVCQSPRPLLRGTEHRR